ncbi:polysaccharide export protein [Luteolibacter pohnpeiensis]|uniref:Polysaccharide export protein n=1 Tax=Luteolibacter pohnpeiensis TaxID=454153 RepID=A0A934VQR4_9BACT|nr:polysaccharide biosynthesis/export family protein [Luteolibacter pohnpeiensis]MBK1882381.1 polysaccharide export protein [Luteolibacter pohnpeiensis]
MKWNRLIASAALCIGLVWNAAMADDQGGSSGVIGRLDTVEIRVFREDDLTTRGQLSADGTISMPLIGSVRIEGLNTDQAAAEITRKLHAGYLVKPEVSVSIENRIRRTVTVLGQAQRPGVFEIPAHRQLTLVEAIGMAGGLTRIANDRKIHLKRNSSSGESEVLTINLRDVTTGKSKDIPLRDGDVVSISESLF